MKAQEIWKAYCKRCRRQVRHLIGHDGVKVCDICGAVQMPKILGEIPFKNSGKNGRQSKLGT